MTTQEAIKLLRNDEYDTWCSTEGLQARDMAIKALEKQIPKKARPVVRDITIGCYGKEYEVLAICPTCNVPFVGCVPAYCASCGQRIDWEEKNDQR